MREFTFKESDKEGAEILESIGAAPLFNKWMYETIRPYCNGKILEIGSGTGNISEFFINNQSDIYLSDIRRAYSEILKEKFPSHKDKVSLIDLTNENFSKEYAPFLESFDTVFALNVLEHIKDDHKALCHCMKLLKPGGTLVLLVPAYEWLYNTLDEELYHYRRYTRSGLEKVLDKSAFHVQKTFYFNFMGIAGWLYSGSIMKDKTLTKGKMALYNRMMPLNRLMDKITFNRTGLSVIGIARKE